MTALVALMLADRGELDLDAPVTKYWPEFAPHGKSAIATRMFLGHTAGMPGWTETMTFEDILDWEKATTLLARQAPWLPPGTVSAYHPITYGPLIGEVFRGITGKTLKAFFAEEVAGPLGADYLIGAPVEADARVSPMIQGSPSSSRQETSCGTVPITIRCVRRRIPAPSRGGAATWAGATATATHARSRW